MSRKFYLIDSIGRERSLQSDIEFMWEPSGLGFAENREYSQVEYGFFVESSKDFEQPEVAGTLVFKKGVQDPYQTYHEFMDWVQGAKDLQLKYVPYPGRELYLDVNVDGLELSEKTLYGVLECPVIFRGTSPYHKKNPLTFLFRTEDNRNPMRFPFEFPFSFSDSGAGDAQVFTPAGHFPAAMELTINGPVSNIYFKCEDAATGEMIGVLDLSGVSVAEGDHIYYSSRPNADGVWKVSGNTRTDLVEALNENEANFFTLPVGKEIKATLTADTQPTFAKIARIGGNSVQETGENIPSPEHPSEIKSAGDGGSVDIAVNDTNVLNILMEEPLRRGDYIDPEAGETVRNIGAVEYDGTEAWICNNIASSAGKLTYNFLVPLSDAAPETDSEKYMCSHGTVKDAEYNSGQEGMSCNYMTGGKIGFAIHAGRIGSTTDDTNAVKVQKFQTWLAAQKAAGTPVMVQYELGEPVRTPTTIDTTIGTRTGTNTVTTSGSVTAWLEVSADGKMYSGETVSFEVGPITHVLQVHEYYKG